MADEPSEEDVIAMAEHPLVAVWQAGGSAVTSEDFRDANDDLDEAAYVRYALNVMRQVHAEVVAAAESRGRAAGYADAVQALRLEMRDQFAHWWAHVRDPEKPIPGGWTDLAADYLEHCAGAIEASAARATTEETPGV